MTSRRGRRNRWDRSDQQVFHVQNRSWKCESDLDLATSPDIVGYFSIDENRKYLPDASTLSYYKAPETEKVCFDLNKGIDDVRRKPPVADNAKIAHLLQWIKLNYDKVRAPVESKRWIQPDFVCFRGRLTSLLCTVNSPSNAWIICASKWKGTIYLCPFKTAEEKRQYANMSKFMSWGFKLENYITADAPDKQPDTSKPVLESLEFCCIFQRRIGEHSILYCAEMDGVVSEKKLEEPLPLKDLRFVEIKTSKELENVKQDKNFRRFKLLKWWAQSYPVGVEKIVCGFKDDTGIVRNLKSYTLSDITHQGKGYWDPKECMNFCRAFLTHVSETVVNDCDKTIYKFERKPFENIVTSEVSHTSEYAFMEPWYLEGIE